MKWIVTAKRQLEMTSSVNNDLRKELEKAMKQEGDEFRIEYERGRVFLTNGVPLSSWMRSEDDPAGILISSVDIVYQQPLTVTYGATRHDRMREIQTTR
jgi:hypothetical protein